MNVRHTGKCQSSINIKLLVLASHSTSKQHNTMPHAGRNESSLVGALVFCPRPKALQVHFHTACAGSLVLLAALAQLWWVSGRCPQLLGVSE